MLPRYQPPVTTTPKPYVPDWIPPAPTEEHLDWAALHTIELSDLDSPDATVVASLIATTKTAIKNDGFLYVTHYGVSLAQLHRHFSLAQYTHSNISDVEKQRLLWNPSNGVYAGFKPRTGWQREAGKVDGIEHFNFYAPQFAHPEINVPGCILPFMDEITSFCAFLTQSVTRRLLVLLSRVLELPDDYLWDNVQSHGEEALPVGEGYFRHAVYYPLDEEVNQQRKAVRMYGHRDFGCLTLLFSVPVTALQVFGRDGKWRFVKYNPGALVVNLGEALEIISGGHFKATLHKVADTPDDQKGLQRLSIVLFNASKGNLRLKPAMESPLLQREGLLEEQGVFREFKALMDAGLPVPTNREWREAQVAARSQMAPEERLGGVKEVNGVKYGEDKFMGVKVMLPV